MRNDLRYVDRGFADVEQVNYLLHEACASDADQRRLCVDARELSSEASSNVPEVDGRQGHVLLSGDTYYTGGCTGFVPNDHSDFARGAFRASSVAAVLTPVSSQVTQADSFRSTAISNSEEEVFKLGSADSLPAFREKLQTWALNSRTPHAVKLP
ncbi:hypothetical protein HPB50_015890 [Hyalomma asiaticum]|uniref:Uncharacterized protein n=1 Tax=Hyalomma asiaticum TaxID=266040 RepID=A0ACB7SK56_HYAAI|nr:hypothetical protein HPB50_015890 [Hyalomma asiaticum]